jgi:hypothetical protein
MNSSLPTSAAGTPASASMVLLSLLVFLGLGASGLLGLHTYMHAHDRTASPAAGAHETVGAIHAASE